MNPGEAPIAEMWAALDQEFDVLLLPVSHPSLGPVRIADELFAIGRSEAPFADYPHELVTKLSRRHARLFIEQGAVYVADLDSKNGTSINGHAVRETPARLRAGDELGFGGALTYRVAIETRPSGTAASRDTQHVTVALQPERTDLGLEPIDVAAFPFLVSKTDELFSRYRDQYPHQVNYISRRHAHLFLKGGEPWIEDLGSTNGTFLNRERIGDSARPLANGDIVGFGGDHFVYRVMLKTVHDAEPTVTQTVLESRPEVVESPPLAIPPCAVDPDKTTFVGAAHSFLDIFCVDPALAREDEVNEAAAAAPAVDPTPAERDRKPRRRWQILAAELTRTFAAGDRAAIRRFGWSALATCVAIATVAVGLRLHGAQEREVKELLAGGRYEAAADAAESWLQSHPTNDTARALASEALMKARVPAWLTALRGRQFDQAGKLVDEMHDSSTSNADASTLVDQLQWVGDLERFVVGRGGSDAPIRIYSDESRIRDLLRRWNDDAKGHQRTLDRIASYVPAFAEPYALAMSHLRKLQSDNSVYLAAIDRLDATIANELERDNPQALPAVLDDYTQRYPRLAGLDAVRADLAQYMHLADELRVRHLAALLDTVRRARFATPPFQARFRELRATRLPSEDVSARYEAVSAAWRNGDSQRALDGLAAIPAGPWSDVLAADLARRRAVLAQFADLQKNHGAPDRDDRLLAFYASLDPHEDVYYAHAVQADVDALRDRVLARANAQIDHARALWRQYRANGSIGGTQRLEGGISEGFRSQAGLLSEANDVVRQGVRVFTQLKVEHPPGADELATDIEDETRLQRRSLDELRMVLDPGLLKSKLALIGGDDSETRKSP